MATAAIVGFGMTCGSVTGEIKSISWSGATATDIEIGSAVSADGYKDFVSGLKDAGTITVTALFTNVLGELANLGADASSISLTFGADSSSFSCSGYINSIEVNAEYEGVVEKTIGFKLSGKPTFGVA